ncbi:4180_t:CDS:2 [Funneliformis caledonium]|uniref:4180_t:CDS:1 n=1 Tax=Funneliformis caledonium TaxID=1117310 RepID=A0A9N9B413_9GLOM|nr:4180_t:CDS:2 [Funneliformis caledonium]
MPTTRAINSGTYGKVSRAKLKAFVIVELRCSALFERRITSN